MKAEDVKQIAESLDAIEEEISGHAQLVSAELEFISGEDDIVIASYDGQEWNLDFAQAPKPRRSGGGVKP